MKFKTASKDKNQKLAGVNANKLVVKVSKSSLKFNSFFSMYQCPSCDVGYIATEKCFICGQRVEFSDRKT